MKIKNFKLFNESEVTTEANKGFDWFDQNYLTNNGWIKKDKIGSHFEHISPSGGYFHIIFKEDPQKGDGFELVEVVDKQTTPIKTIFKKENCWDYLRTWQKQTFKKSNNDDNSAFDKVKKMFN